MSTPPNGIPALRAGRRSSRTIQPRGSTPLYDAIGYLLDRAEAEGRTRAARGLPAEDHLVVILTDGLENASRSWNQASVFERIAGLEASGWTFAYLGANQDAFAEGRRLGVSAGSTDNWDHTPLGASMMLDKVSKAALRHRAKGRPERFSAKEDFFVDPDADGQNRP